MINRTLQTIYIV